MWHTTDLIDTEVIRIEILFHRTILERVEYLATTYEMFGM